MRYEGTIQEILQSVENCARTIEHKYRDTVLGGVIDGLNKSEAIDLNIEYGRQAIQSQLTVANERIAEQDDYIDVIFEQFHAQEIGVIEDDEQIGVLRELLGRADLFVPNDTELHSKISALKAD